MNKTSKKHWYDKPLKFVLFIMSVLPFILMIFNSFTPGQQTTEKNASGTENINTYYEIAVRDTEEDGNYTWGTTKDKGLYILVTTANQINPRWQITYGNSQDGFLPNFLANLFDKLIETDIYKSNNTNHMPMDTGEAIPYFLQNLCLYETMLICYWILLKVILFLPNVICYVLDWTERKLNV